MQPADWSLLMIPLQKLTVRYRLSLDRKSDRRYPAMFLSRKRLDGDPEVCLLGDFRDSQYPTLFAENSPCLPIPSPKKRWIPARRPSAIIKSHAWKLKAEILW
jgi:hypothetical protein